MAVETTYVTFSDQPLSASKHMIALAGNTDDEMSLKELLLLMYRTWTHEAFQEGIRAERPRIVVPGNGIPETDL